MLLIGSVLVLSNIVAGFECRGNNGRPLCEYVAPILTCYCAAYIHDKSYTHLVLYILTVLFINIHFICSEPRINHRATIWEFPYIELTHYITMHIILWVDLDLNHARCQM